MSIKDFLFGKKILIKDDFFGDLESNRTKKRDDMDLPWYSYYQIGKFSEKTLICADGNYLGINKLEKERLVYFVKNYENEFIPKIDLFFQSDEKFLKLLNTWKSDYYISSIFPNDYPNERLSFDIEFESYKNSKSIFSFELIDRNLTDFYSNDPSLKMT